MVCSSGTFWLYLPEWAKAKAVQFEPGQKIEYNVMTALWMFLIRLLAPMI